MRKLIIGLFLFILCNSLYAEKGSVVCIHGFIRSYKCMIPMGNALEDEGLDVYLWDYQSRKDTIQGHADNLVEILCTIAEKHPGEPIHFVTHSLGGVITKTAINHPRCPEEAKVGRAVLLAPPAQGSSLARAVRHITPVRWFFGEKAGHQLLTYTPDDMENLGEFPNSMDVMVISGARGHRFFFVHPNDGKVSVNETRLNTPHEHYVLNVSHNWIMTSRESIDMTKNFLLNKPASDIKEE